MDKRTESGHRDVIEAIRRATNQHDLDALAACFAPDYRSEFPAHPDRAFGGREQMRRNWAQIFAAVPDIRSTVVRSAVEGDTVWAEWEWTGTLVTGEPFLHRGVTIQGVEQGMTGWVRLYMEPVREGGPGIESLGRGVLK
jgi:ketosteroid isomerase-like protein